MTGISENFWSAFKDSLDQYNTDIIQQENQKAVDSVQDLSTATEETETDKTVEIDASEAVTATEQVNGLSDAAMSISDSAFPTAPIPSTGKTIST